MPEEYGSHKYVVRRFMPKKMIDKFMALQKAEDLVAMQNYLLMNAVVEPTIDNVWLSRDDCDGSEMLLLSTLLSETYNLTEERLAELKKKAVRSSA